MKNKQDKKVNKSVRMLNKNIREDVFGNRFEIRQVQKSRYTDCPEICIYRYKLIDYEEQKRNYETRWYSCFEICVLNKLWIEMNDFIVKSDFWYKYRSGKNE